MLKKLVGIHVKSKASSKDCCVKKGENASQMVVVSNRVKIKHPYILLTSMMRGVKRPKDETKVDVSNRVLTFLLPV